MLIICYLGAYSRVRLAFSRCWSECAVVCVVLFIVVHRADVVCYADKPVSVLGYLPGFNFQPFFIRNRESALHFPGLIFKGNTRSLTSW